MLHSRFPSRLVRVGLAFGAGVALLAAASAEAHRPLRFSVPPTIDRNADASLAFTQCGAVGTDERCIELRVREYGDTPRTASTTVDIWQWFENPTAGSSGFRALTCRFDSGAPFEARRTVATVDVVLHARDCEVMGEIRSASGATRDWPLERPERLQAYLHDPRYLEQSSNRHLMLDTRTSLVNRSVCRELIGHLPEGDLALGAWTFAAPVRDGFGMYSQRSCRSVERFPPPDF